MTEQVEAIKIEPGARYAIIVNGLPADREAEFAAFMSEQMEKWDLSNQKFLVLTAPSGLELRFERVGAEDVSDES